MKAVARSLEVSRSNLYEQKDKQPRPRRYRQMPEDVVYLSLIRPLVDERPSYGYRRITELLNRKLEIMGKPRVNHKRVYRIMRVYDLLLEKHTGKKPTRTHDGTIITLKSDTRWCSDTLEFSCWNGETVRVGFSLDCCDREAMTYVATTRGIDGEMIRDLLAESVETRFGDVEELPHPIEWLTDNGSIYTAHQTVDFARRLGFIVCTTPVDSPESNGMAEAFVKTFKRDYVAFGNLRDAKTVMEQLPKWFEDYNEVAPHKGLKMKSPRQYRREVKMQVSA